MTLEVAIANATTSVGSNRLNLRSSVYCAERRSRITSSAAVDVDGWLEDTECDIIDELPRDCDSDDGNLFTQLNSV